MGRVHASAASALPDEKGAGGAGYGLLAGAEVVQMIGKGAAFSHGGRNVHVMDLGYICCGGRLHGLVRARGRASGSP